MVLNCGLFQPGPNVYSNHMNRIIWLQLANRSINPEALMVLAPQPKKETHYNERYGVFKKQI